MNVLILEDEPDLILYYSRLCRKMGFGFFVAVNNDEASEIINENVVDVIISDFNLNGTDSSRALQLAQDKNPNVNSIVITGFASSNVFDKLQSVNNLTVLEKPVRSQSLKSLLEFVRPNEAS